MKDEEGSRRLGSGTDYVRLEIAAALRRDIPVVPVLLRGANTPRAEQLPEEISELAYRNAVELTHARWKGDVQLLVKALRPLVGDSKEPAATAVSSSPLDGAVVQRIARELAAYIGPIADIVVKRAVSRCKSAEELYLSVAGEIEAQSDREKFLGCTRH